MPTLSAAWRHDLADDEWRVLEPLLPKGQKPGRSFAPALSLMFAAVTTRASSQPSVSTAICRPRPVTFLPPW